jgi:hypothetical protein
LADKAETEASDDESIITPAMRAAIGAEGEPFTIELPGDLVSRTAETLEADNPELRAALTAGVAGTEVPPWAILTYYGRLRSDAMPGAPERGLQAADEYTILGPIRPDDRLTIVQWLADVQERMGSGSGTRCSSTSSGATDGYVTARPARKWRACATP